LKGRVQSGQWSTRISILTASSTREAYSATTTAPPPSPPAADSGATTSCLTWPLGSSSLAFLALLSSIADGEPQFLPLPLAPCIILPCNDCEWISTQIFGEKKALASSSPDQNAQKLCGIGTSMLGQELGELFTRRVLE
jgi:hypothetical protein